MYKLIITSLCLFISSLLFSQTEIGAEYQHGFGKSYNSNSLGALYENFSSGRGSLCIVAHYTWDIFTTKKVTKGVSDLGISFGYRYGFSYGNSGNLFTGIRATFSFIDEKDHIKFTPSAELGYHLTFNNFGKGGFTTPSIAFGYDLPLVKKEEDYQGPLFIPRLAVGYRF